MLNDDGTRPVYPAAVMSFAFERMALSIGGYFNGRSAAQAMDHFLGAGHVLAAQEEEDLLACRWLANWVAETRSRAGEADGIEAIARGFTGVCVRHGRCEDARALLTTMAKLAWERHQGPLDMQSRERLRMGASVPAWQMVMSYARSEAKRLPRRRQPLVNRQVPEAPGVAIAPAKPCTDLQWEQAFRRQLDHPHGGARRPYVASELTHAWLGLVSSEHEAALLIPTGISTPDLLAAFLAFCEARAAARGEGLLFEAIALTVPPSPASLAFDPAEEVSPSAPMTP